MVVSVGNSAEVVGAIIGGNVELGYVEGPEDEFSDSRLAIELIAMDELVMIASANHPWTISERLTVEDLTAGKWVLREDGSGTRAAFVKALDALGVPYGKLDIAIELPSNEAVLAAVLAGAGAAILSALVCADAIKAGVLKRLPVFYCTAGVLRCPAWRPLSLSCRFGIAGNPPRPCRIVAFTRRQ